jgi:RimJ/RimL family protein N-acetyltransferase
MIPLFRTARLDVVPLTADLAADAIEDRQLFEQKLEVILSPSWPLPEFAAHLPYLEKALRHNPGHQPFGGILIVREGRRVVGEVGFHGSSEDDGTFEVGYSVVPEARAKGFATEALLGLLRWGRGQLRGCRIVARVEEGNRASQRVLEKSGFQLSGETEDGLQVFELPVVRPEAV